MRAQALAQHGFERVFPARLDVEQLPQPARAGEAVVGEPVVDVRRHGRSSPAARQAPAAALRGRRAACSRAPTRRRSRAGSPAALPRSCCSAASASCLPARSAFSCASCSSTSRMRSVAGARDRRQLLRRGASAARRAACSDCAALSRRVSATRSRLLGQRDALLHARASAGRRRPAPRLRAPAAPLAPPALRARPPRARPAPPPARHRPRRDRRCERRFLPGQRGRALRSSCATCCAMRVSDSRANESCCSSRVTSALAA